MNREPLDCYTDDAGLIRLLRQLPDPHEDLPGLELAGAVMVRVEPQRDALIAELRELARRLARAGANHSVPALEVRTLAIECAMLHARLRVFFGYAEGA